MSNELDKQSSNNSGSEALALATGAVTDILTGATIPAPIRRNVWKAFGQLASAALDIPVAYLEGIAVEKRAETQARVKLISTNAEQLASQMNVTPEYVQAAANRYAQKIVQEQVNLDKVCEVAAQHIKEQTSLPGSTSWSGNQETPDEQPEIRSEWLNQFEKVASQMASEEMQQLFGRILAGEIQRPSTFSIRAVKLLGELDTDVAALFRRACSLSFSIKIQGKVEDARIVAVNEAAGSNGLAAFGLRFWQLSILVEYGLIAASLDSRGNYSVTLAGEGEDATQALAITYQNEDWNFVPLEGRSSKEELFLSGVTFSKTGKELLGIVDIERNEVYTAALQEYLKKSNIAMRKANQPASPSDSTSYTQGT